MKSCLSHRKHQHGKHPPVSRRDFLQTAGIAAAGLLLAGCQTRAPFPTSQAPVSENGAAAAIKAQVAMTKADSYDRKLVRQSLEAMFDSLGGLGDVLAHGTRVAIKTNLTGGTATRPLPGVAEIDSYLTHPEVVRALVELLRDSGAKDIFIVEAVYEDESWPHYQYTDMAKEVGATLVDLNKPEPYGDFVEVTTSTQPYWYEKIKLNPLLTELDALVSVSKLKCHNVAGVTHTMKNLFGLAPLQFYRNGPNDSYRSEFHGSDPGKRVPGVIMDINRARPVTLSVIDGIYTMEGGEGPWIQGTAANKTNVLIAGKNPVATDSVGTAVMGFDPTADFPNEPFVNGINHIKMAAELGLGTNKLEEIQVLGPSIQEVQTKFKVSF